MGRGDRFARHKPPRRNAEGRSLPSDASMQYVALDAVCRRCMAQDEVVSLGWFQIDSRHDSFDAARVAEGQGKALEVQHIPEPDGSIRKRYKMHCRKCGHSPVLRGEKVDEALEEVYTPFQYARPVRYPV